MNYSCLLDDIPTQQLQVGNHYISYHKLGSGPSLFLLPGTIGDHRTFCVIVPLLADSYTLFMLDIISSDDVHEVATVYGKVIQILTNQPVHLLGTSVGGWLAQYIAQLHPELIDHLILSSTFCENRILKEKNGFIYSLSRFIPWFVFSRVFKRAVKSSVPEYWHSEESRSIFAEYISSTIDNMGKTELRKRFALSLTNASPPKVDYTIPKLIIFAADDTTVPKSSYDIIQQTYPDAKTIKLDQGEHFPYLFNPKTYAEEVRQFLDYS